MKIPKMTSEVCIVQLFKASPDTEVIFRQPKNFWEKIVEEMIENGMREVHMIRGETDIVKIVRP